jgi:hypothetical protein
MALSDDEDRNEEERTRTYLFDVIPQTTRLTISLETTSMRTDVFAFRFRIFNFSYARGRSVLSR